MHGERNKTARRENMCRNGFWLVTTEHLPDGLWFRDEDDFKVAMNMVAALSTVTSATICAFILMSNHVHFLLRGRSEDAEDFIQRFKKHYSQYFSHRIGGNNELLRKNRVDMREVFIVDESFHRAFAYIQMNAVAANLCMTSANYRWGTGNTFFREAAFKGKQVGNISKRMQKRLTHTNLTLPEYFLIDDGIIDPCSYVAVEFIESVFRGPKRMNYYLNTSSKAKTRKEGPAFSDQVVRSAHNELLRSLFRKTGIEQMDAAEQVVFLKQMRYRFSCDAKQLSRVCGIPCERVEKILDSI